MEREGEGEREGERGRDETDVFSAVCVCASMHCMCGHEMCENGCVCDRKKLQSHHNNS